MINKSFHAVSIILVFVITIIHFGIMQIEHEDIGLFYNLTLMVSLAAVAIMAGLIYHRYIGERKFRLPYLFLSLSYIAYFLGEVGWFVYENILFEYPYPSVADVGFFFDFVFTGLFLVATIRLFSKLTRYSVGAASLIMSVITSIYLTISIDAQTPLYDLIFGLIFIIASSMVFSYSLIALYKLKGTTIGLAWMIIFLAFLVSTVADFTYYTTENIGVYTYADPANTLWIVSNALLVYALILHRRVL